MSREMRNGMIRLGFIQLWVTIILLGGFVSPAHGAKSSMDEVYSVLDLTNRAMDVLLAKSKGIDKVASPRLKETGLQPVHVYQLQVSNLDLIRQLEIKFTMVPAPMVVLPPGLYKTADVQHVTAMLLAEVRRLAIQINIWGLPKKKRAFTSKSASDAFVLAAEIRTKLLLLGGLALPGSSKFATELGRAVADMEAVLGVVDPKKRYRVIPEPSSVSTLAKMYPLVLQLRSEFNGLRRFFKMTQVRVPKPAAKFVANGTDMYLQSQIILADLNQLKWQAGSNAITPRGKVISGTGSQVAEAARQLSLLSLLVSQLQSVAAMDR